MQEKISVKELQVGMYVFLKGNWLSHPFRFNEFLITSPQQIQKISQHFHSVYIDRQKGRPTQAEPEAPQPTSDTHEQPPVILSKPVEGVSWEAKNRPADALNQVLHSDMAPAEKSDAIFKHSVELMDELLSSEPDQQAIEAFSKPIKELAELVVSDDEVARNLLSITSHDYYTYTHCVNVGLKAMILARNLTGSSDINLLKELSVGFFLHDIGKSSVDPGILNKPGKLNAEELEIMRSHPQRGIEILRNANSLTESGRLITLQHHEKSDGSGYPHGLKSCNIHLFSRICAFADVYDALTAERSYKKGMTPFEALYLIKHQMKGHFDEKLVGQAIGVFAAA